MKNKKKILTKNFAKFSCVKFDAFQDKLVYLFSLRMQPEKNRSANYND